MGLFNKIITAAKRLHDSLDEKLERVNTLFSERMEQHAEKQRELKGLQQLIDYTQTIIANTDDASKRAGLEAELEEYEKTYLSISGKNKKPTEQIVPADAAKTYVRAPFPITVGLRPAVSVGVASLLVGLGLYFGVAAAQPAHSQATAPEETKTITQQYTSQEESSDTYHNRIMVARRANEGSRNLWETIQKNKYTNPEFSRFIEKEEQEGAKYTVAEQAKSAATPVEETTAAAVPSTEKSLETRVQGSEDKKPAANKKVEPEKDKDGTQQPEITTSTRGGTIYTKKRPGKPEHYFTVSVVPPYTTITNYPVGSKLRDPTHAKPVSHYIGQRNGLGLYAEAISHRHGKTVVSETNYVLTDKTGAIVCASDSLDFVNEFAKQHASKQEKKGVAGLENSNLEEKVGYDTGMDLAQRYNSAGIHDRLGANLEEFAQLYNSGKILACNKEETNPFAYGSIAEYVAAANAAGIKTNFNGKAAEMTGGTEFIANAYRSGMKIKDIRTQYAANFTQNLSTGSLYRVLDNAGVKRRTKAAEKVAAKEKVLQEELRLAA